MRILLVTHYYAPEIGAPQRRWSALVERFVAAGHEVAVLAPTPHYPSGLPLSADPRLRPGAVARGHHGETVHRLHFREYDRDLGRRGLDQLVTAADALRTGLARFSGRHRPDVIIATVPGMPTLPTGLALGAALRRPVVVEMRDAWPDLLTARHRWDGETSAGGTHTLSTRAMGRVVTALQRRASAVVTTTETFAEILRERGMRRVLTIRHGTHTPAAPEVPVETRPSLAPLRVLYAGTVGRSQGLDSAVRAAAESARNGVPIELRIVGEGAELAPVAELARSLEAPVTFVPPVNAVELAAHYAWAETILVPLRAWEPLRWTVPSKLYDALATGRHVTAALGGEAAEIVRRTTAGHVVPSEDPGALEHLWAQLGADRAQLRVGDTAKDWVATNADDDALAGRYMALLQEVARG